MNINKTQIAGRLTRDPEVRYTSSGTAVVEIGLAVNRYRTSKEGEKIEEVTYLDARLWGKSAENVGKHFYKGKEIYLEGRLELDQWEDKQTGNKRQKLMVIGEHFQFVGPPDGKKPDNPDPGEAYRKKAGVAPESNTQQEDGIPF